MGVGQGGNQEHNDHPGATEVLCKDVRTCRNDDHLSITPYILSEWLDRGHLTVCQTAFNGLWDCEEKDSLDRSPSTSSGEHQALLITWLVPSLQWSMTVTALCYKGASQQQGQGHWSELIESWIQPNTEKSFNKPACKSACDLRMGRLVSFQHSGDWKYTAKKIIEWLWEKSLTALEWPTQDPWLEPHRISVERPKDDCSQTLPILSDGAWEDLPGRMG